MAFFQEAFSFGMFEAFVARLRTLAFLLVLVLAGTGPASAQFSIDTGGDRPGMGSRDTGTRDMGARDKGDMHRGGMGGDAMRSGIGIGIGIGGALIEGATKEDAQKKSGATAPVQDQKKKANRKGDDTPVAVKPPKTPPMTTNKPPPTTTDKPPPTTTDQPPVTTTDKPPETPLPPTTAGPPPTSPPGSPPDTTTTTTTTIKTGLPVSPRRPSNLTGEDCPQRGDGCIALVIDYLKYNDWAFGWTISSLPEALPGMCETNVVTPRFKEIPSSYSIEVKGLDIFMRSNADEIKEVKQYNTDERNRMQDEIEKHRASIVDKKPELAMEFISGHGSHDRCGALAGRGELGRSLDRASFHEGNYNAVKHNVCGWVVGDFSCGSGRTAEAVDQLNNLGEIPKIRFDSEQHEITPPIIAGCRAKPKDECTNHAAYDYDLAMGTVASDKYSCGVMFPAHQKQIQEALGLPVAPSTPGIAERATPPPPPPAPNSIPVPRALKIDRLKFDSFDGFGSHYGDAGYKHCDPVTRAGIWNDQLTSK